MHESTLPSYQMARDLATEVLGHEDTAIHVLPNSKCTSIGKEVFSSLQAQEKVSL